MVVHNDQMYGTLRVWSYIANKDWAARNGVFALVGSCLAVRDVNSDRQFTLERECAPSHGLLPL